MPTRLQGTDYTTFQLLRRYPGLPYKRLVLILDRLGIAPRVGRIRAVKDADIPLLEIVLRGMGFEIPADAPQEESVAG